MDNEDASKAASKLSKLGASKGGKARAERLTPEQRREIARYAVQTRWLRAGKSISVPRATHAGTLKLGDLELACANLPDGRRVIAEVAMLTALGRGYSGYYSQRDAAAAPGTAVPPRYLSPAVLKPYISEELANLQPIPYLTPTGTFAKGLSAEVVPQICEVWLKAREAGKLKAVQLRAAAKAEIILRGLARVGIIALIDEATGYQDTRARDALAEILEAFVAKEIRAWVKTFPPDFYREMFRLRRLPYPPRLRKPRYIGHLTNDLIYARLAPGVLKELQAKNPTQAGRRKHKHHQWLTEEIGNPKLQQHLIGVTTLMRATNSWEEFKKMLDRALPKHIPLPLFDGIDDEESDK